MLCDVRTLTIGSLVGRRLAVPYTSCTLPLLLVVGRRIGPVTLVGLFVLGLPWCHLARFPGLILLLLLLLLWAIECWSLLVFSFIAFSGRSRPVTGSVSR